MTDSSGPTAPPVLLIVWHLRQAASFLRVLSRIVWPRSTFPLRAKRAWMLGSLLGSSLGGAGSTTLACFLMSLKELFRKRRERSGVRSSSRPLLLYRSRSQVAPSWEL